jgi:hypothetical protein
MASVEERLETLEREVRVSRVLLLRVAIDIRARRNEYRGSVAVLAVLVFLAWLIRRGDMRATEIAALAAALLGALGLFFAQVDRRARREKATVDSAE